MNPFGTAKPKPGTAAELAEEARGTASKIRTDALGSHPKAFENAAGVAKGLEKIADDLDTIE